MFPPLPYHRFLFGLAMIFVTSCNQDNPVDMAAVKKSQSDFPVFEDSHLQYGREIWLGTCKACHAQGVAGAPKAEDATAWQPRINQGRTILYSHAIEGFFGPEYTQMPPRGGNTSLSDEEVKAAVDYMLAMVSVVD